MNKPFFEQEPELNVFGERLEICSADPLTGFFRNGSCSTGPEDAGRHTICCRMTDAFLGFSASRGNDLTTSRPEFAFPGLEAGDRWCLVAMRWLEAHAAGMAPRVYLRSTHQSVLGLIPLEVLKLHALDLS